MDKNTKKQIDIINQRIKELNSVYHVAALQSGISDGELSIWSVMLNSDEQYSQQDLCELLSLSKQTVNSIVSNLIKKGFVILEHVPGTRNRKVICLTKEGGIYGRDKVMWIFEAEQKALEQTDPEQVKVCIEMMEKYIRLLKNELNLD